MKVVLSTSNKGKISEINGIFSGFGMEFVGYDQFPNIPELIEDGKSFQENALKKALPVFKATGIPTLSEDSGLEVFALHNAPGIFSARFAGPEANDRDNIEKILSMLSDIPESNRKARFVSVFCLVMKEDTHFFEGEVKGDIIYEPKGESGFGYDPVFLPDGYDKTFAELGSEVKNSISHRANAIKKLKKFLNESGLLGLST